MKGLGESVILHNETRKATVLSRIVRRIIIAIWHLQGWRIDERFPKHLKRCVIAGAPHSTAWDFVFFAGATHEEQVQPNFMGKHTLFEGFMRNFMLDMGGIPVNKTKRTSAVEQIAAEYEKRPELSLVIAAEGTRKTNGKWKSGFYHIAQAAGVPIVPAYADNENRIIGFGPPLIPTGNYGEDLLKLAQWFRSKLPDYERYKVLEQQAKDIIAGRNDR